jgi:hypothetical protein
VRHYRQIRSLLLFGNLQSLLLCCSGTGVRETWVLDLFRTEVSWRILTVPEGTVSCYRSQRTGIVILNKTPTRCAVDLKS